MAQAHRRCLQRTLAAMLREGMLPQDRLTYREGSAWLPLDDARTLQLTRMRPNAACDDLWQAPEAVVCHSRHEHAVTMETAAALLRLVAPLHDKIDPAAVDRLELELDNSVANDALAMAHRKCWGRKLRADYAGATSSRFLGALREIDAARALLLLEQWGTQGHPTHPTYKAKGGLTAQQVLAWSPEFGARLALVLAALRIERANVTQVPEIADYRDWFGQQWPQVALAWQHALARRGMRAGDWLPLPLHPWQARYSVSQRFARLLEEGDLILLEEVHWPAAPTMSFRTVSCEQGAAVPHIKLPVSLWLTSAERTVSPKSTVMGPRLTVLLRDVLAREPEIRRHLACVDELAGLHYRHPEGNDDVSRHLSVLYRRHPVTLTAAGEQTVPVGALFAPSPFDGRLLVTDAVAQGYGDHAEGARAFYLAYVEMALQAVLQLYLIYGIALEAHQQNSFVVLDARGQPSRLLVRDFGDVRVHAPTLQVQGLRLQPYRAGLTLYEEVHPVRDKVMHAFLLCHLIELARALAAVYGQSAQSYLALLQQGLERLFMRLQPRVDPRRWQDERDAILRHPWPAKSFLRMRLNNSSDDVVLRMPNPLRGS